MGICGVEILVCCAILRMPLKYIKCTQYCNFSDIFHSKKSPFFMYRYTLTLCVGVGGGVLYEFMHAHSVCACVCVSLCVHLHVHNCIS